MKTKISNIGKIEQMVAHHVGNKTTGDGVGFGLNLIPLEDIESDIIALIQKSFDLGDFYHFYFESTVDLNPVYSFVKAIFHNHQEFLQQSKHIAKILYECSTHPKIKSGELSVYLIKDCQIEGGSCDAIAIIKSETPQQLLQFNRSKDGVTAVKASGMSLSKIEKGCIVFNRFEADGYQIAIIDNTKTSTESQYWKDGFLHVRSYNGPQHQTSNLVTLCDEFINTKLVDNDKISKVQKAMISARSKQVLHANDVLTIKEYEDEVFQDFVLATQFGRFVEERGMTDQIQKDGVIKIDKSAIKKSKTKVDTIKLDKNFDLRIYGGEDRIIQGYDSNAGMKFYTLYYEEEQ